MLVWTNFSLVIFAVRATVLAAEALILVSEDGCIFSCSGLSDFAVSVLIELLKSGGLQTTGGGIITSSSSSLIDLLWMAAAVIILLTKFYGYN